MDGRAVQQEVLDGFLCVPAPGAVGVGGQAQAVEMSSELGVSQTEVGEGTCCGLFTSGATETYRTAYGSKVIIFYNFYQ